MTESSHDKKKELSPSDQLDQQNRDKHVLPSLECVYFGSNQAIFSKDCNKYWRINPMSAS